MIFKGENMKQRQIDIYDYMNEIHRALKKGITITAKKGDKVNPMTISWGQIGIEWNKPIFTTFVRGSRLTYELLQETGEFTVNIPLEDRPADVIAFCGSKSGRDFDKIKELGLELAPGINVDVPGIKQLPLTLECKVIYKNDQNITAIPEEEKTKFYPSNTNFHTEFYGEIVGAYIIEE